MIQNNSPQGRRSVRLVPTVPVVVRLDSSDMSLELYDLSLGGFAVLAERPFAPGMTHRFTFEVPSEGLMVRIVAKAVHGRASTKPEVLAFVSGWEFMFARTDADRAAIAQLFETATRAA